MINLKETTIITYIDSENDSEWQYKINKLKESYNNTNIKLLKIYITNDNKTIEKYCEENLKNIKYQIIKEGD